MSRNKRRGNSEVDNLRSENKELKSTIKSLLRQIKKIEKEYKTEFVQEELITEEIAEKVPKCTKCGRGKIVEINLGIKNLLTCTICDFKKTVNV